MPPTRPNPEFRYEDGRPIEIPKAKDRNYWRLDFWRKRATAAKAVKAANHARNIAIRAGNKAVKVAARDKVA